VIMKLSEKLSVFLGKSISVISTKLRFGAGATWPGEIALRISPHILSVLGKQFKKGIILIVGTNGKTTTSLMIRTILSYEGYEVITNDSGANLLNGLVSACIKKGIGMDRSSAEWGVFEVDENSLPIILRYISPKMIVLLNLFRDQLDRYGEVDIIAEKWGIALKKISQDTTLVCNADDPLIASIAKKTGKSSVYFGLSIKTVQDAGIDHATDSIFCMNCGSRLSYANYYFSHLGEWFCKGCGEKRPKLTLDSWESPLPGLYNEYNTMAAALTVLKLGIQPRHIKEALIDFIPAFGRQEEQIVDEKKVKILLSKNPAGFNASLRTALDMKPKVLLLALNDRIPDGRDVSWIWDVDFEMIPADCKIIVSGDRVYDMALRIEYSATGYKRLETRKMIVEPDLKKAINKGLETILRGETYYILATYSAMLDIRKIIIGRKIL